VVSFDLCNGDAEFFCKEGVRCGIESNDTGYEVPVSEQRLYRYSTSHESSRKWVLVRMKRRKHCRQMPKTTIGDVYARLEQFTSKPL
jgi:hypothetical protein